MFAAVYRSVLFHDDSKLFVFTYIALAVVLAIWLGLFWLAAVVVVHLLLEIVKQHHYDPRPLPVLARSFWELKLDVGLVICGLVIGLYIDVVFGIAGLSAAGRVGAQAAARVGLWQRGIRGVMLTVDDVAIIAKAKGAGKGKSAALEPELATVGIRAEAIPESGDSARGSVPRRMGGGADDADVAASGDRGGRTGESSIEESVEESGVRAGAGDAAHTTRAEQGGHADRGHHRHGPPHRPAVPPAGGQALWGGWAASRWSRGDWLSLAFTVGNVVLILVAPLLTGAPIGEVWSDIIADLHPFPQRH